MTKIIDPQLALLLLIHDKVLITADGLKVKMTDGILYVWEEKMQRWSRAWHQLPSYVYDAVRTEEPDRSEEGKE